MMTSACVTTMKSSPFGNSLLYNTCCFAENITAIPASHPRAVHTATSMSPQIKVGLVGAGLSATTFHLPFLKQSTTFAVTGVLRSSSTSPVPGLEQVPVFDDLQLFLGADPELVVITTPTHTHYSLAKACLESGRHVILEKPMAASYVEAQELCSIARSKDRMLAVYQNRRWDGDFQTAASLIKCGVLGRLVEFESHFDRYRPALKSGWKEDAELPGAGVLFDLGSHLIDQALCLFGSPSKVTGLVANQRHLPVCSIHDAFTMTLHYDRSEGPLTVVLRSSSLCKIPGPRFTLHGTQGSFVKHGMDVQEEQLRAGMNPMQPGFGAERPASYGTLASQAFELDPALQAPAPAGPMESLPELPEGTPTCASPAAAAAAVAVEARDAALEAATAAAMAGRVGMAADEPAATVSSIAAAVLAKIDAGGSSTPGGSSSDSTLIKVVTQQGCWYKFYEEVASILLAARGQHVPHTHSMSRSHSSGAVDAVTEAAGAILGSRGVEGRGGSFSSGHHGAVSSKGSGINSQLSVVPEAAADVIRVIEMVMQSSSEGRTLKFDRDV